MKKVLITGANSQLAQCIKDYAPQLDLLHLQFVDRTTFDLTDFAQMNEFLQGTTFDYCINTAAYTKVEDAESNKELAYAVNAKGVEDLAELCVTHNITLVQVSTDYVFDGEKGQPYLETDLTNPINVYGASKLAGELAIAETLAQHYIVRTSWLYSRYGHNFYRSVRGWAKQGKDLSITTEQTGTPTNANDLAGAILELIDKDPKEYGIYHYSNRGEATWFDFAQAILSETGQIAEVKLVKTDHYPTFAARPAYSVLSCEKYNALGHISTRSWKEGLKQLINRKA